LRAIKLNKIFIIISCLFVLATSLHALSKQEYEAKKQAELEEFNKLEQTSGVFHILRVNNKHDFEYFSLYLNRIVLTTNPKDDAFKEHTNWLKYKTLYGNRDTFFYPAFYGIFLNAHKVYKSATLMSVFALVRLEVDSLRCEQFPQSLHDKWRKNLINTLSFGRFVAYSTANKSKALKLAFKLENYQLGRAKDTRLCNNKFVSDDVWLKRREAKLSQIYKDIFNE